jgi:hypothetical protein
LFGSPLANDHHVPYCSVIRIRRSLVSILEIYFSTLQLHAAKTIQARPAQHRGRATWHLMQSRDVVWKCRKAGCMAILKSRVPQRRGCPAVRRWSLRRTLPLPLPHSTAHRPHLDSRHWLAALHTHDEGSLHPRASYRDHTLSLPVGKLKYGRCSSGASGPLNVRVVHTEASVQRLFWEQLNRTRRLIGQRRGAQQGPPAHHSSTANRGVSHI